MVRDCVYWVVSLWSACKAKLMWTGLTRQGCPALQVNLEYIKMIITIGRLYAVSEAMAVQLPR